jgi:hypothetical protein
MNNQNSLSIEDLKKTSSPIDNKFYRLDVPVYFDRESLPAVCRFYGVHPDNKPGITKEEIEQRLREMVQFEVNMQVKFCVNNDPKFYTRNPADKQFFHPDEQK